MLVTEIKDGCEQLLQVRETKNKLSFEKYNSLYKLPDHIQEELSEVLVKFLNEKEKTLENCIKTLANYEEGNK